MDVASVLLIFLIFICSILQAFAEWGIDDSGCRTPDRETGNCVLITECQTLTDFIEKVNFHLHPYNKVLKSYRCGFEKNLWKICCPKKPLVLRIPQIDNTNGGLNSVKHLNHRNAELLPYNCGTNSAYNKVYNGKEADLNEFPWMALISYDSQNGTQFRCAGSIINERYILTAAHCITKQIQGIRIGEHNLLTKQDCISYSKGRKTCAPPFQDLMIEEIVSHPNFQTNTYVNDIALIRVSSRINITQANVRAICLPIPNADNELSVSTKLVVTGWGVTEKGYRSQVLLKASVPSVNNSNCAIAYQNYDFSITENHICTSGENGTDSCQGDSGGPLQSVHLINNDVRYVQFGIVSVGPRYCANPKFPSIHTNVKNYSIWILDNIKP